MVDNPINVLLFPAEGINTIELHDALSTCVNIRLFGASSVRRTGRYIFENYIPGLPAISDPAFIDRFNDILREHRIDLVFPTHDTVARFLVQNAGRIGSRIVSGDLDTVEICRSKIRTHDLFKDKGFVPRRYTGKGSVDFPLYAKPDEGQGAQGARIVRDAVELEGIDPETFLITEFLPGKEFTVDCLTDAKGVLRYVSPRTRDRAMGGVSVAGRTLPVSDEIRLMAETVNDRLRFLGLWYFQVREDKGGKPKLMEVSSRCAGSMVLTRAKGINLPLLSVYAAMGRDILCFDNGRDVEMERYFTGSYTIEGLTYSTVYIDFDDTVTLNGKVNLNVIRFLYQCHNEGKEVVLLTKHIHDIHASLSRYAISEGLFSRIVPMEEGEKKSLKIETKDAIFIDNMFAERLDVRQVCGIPVFDVDQVEFLLDRRY